MRSYKSSMKSECQRAFLRKEYWIALLIGLGIGLWHFFQCVKNVDLLAYGFPTNTYICWIGIDEFAMQSFLYFLILPLLAAYPFAGSLLEDLKSGYYRQIVIRSGKKTFFISKMVAVFLAGGSCCVIPLLVNFLLTATVTPMLKPDLYVGIGVSTRFLGSTLFYTHPFVYHILYLAFVFLFCGMMAWGAMLLGYYADFKLIVYLLPFGIYYFIYCLCSTFGKAEWSPNMFLIPGIGMENGFILLISAGIMILFGVWNYKKGLQYEN